MIVSLIAEMDFLDDVAHNCWVWLGQLKECAAHRDRLRRFTVKFVNNGCVDRAFMSLAFKKFPS
jgi:hypothetical protein